MRTPLTSAALAAGLLLLAGCGTQTATTPGSRTAVHCVVPDPARDEAAGQGVRITGVTGGGTPECPGSSRNLQVHYEVANDGPQERTYAVVVELRNAAGEVLANVHGTVPDVAPGATVQASVDGSVDGSGTSAASEVTRVRLEQVRRVPAAEAPAAAGPCPASGIRVTADRGDAAMGLRVVGLHLTNCSTKPYTLDGYPAVTPLDEDWKTPSTVTVLHGTGDITTLPDFDAPPRRLTLAPGASATSGLVWRNTVTNGTAVDAPYARVVARPGASPVMLTPELDLGTTGELGVKPWTKDAGRPSPSTPPVSRPSAWKS
ncbi:DUF4232 domain-containing protein [Streptomyces sp. NRRL F-5123]|uniref:DUF4232 domain-containing protein n=1 Tax=Streptomyces sp. NRRL F-5123 TaxID=1463856 RepID=UPI0007C47135|nr:DUF4232 domain-containing protein [Streptomyces sp. NRRL F-5123]